MRDGTSCTVWRLSCSTRRNPDQRRNRRDAWTFHLASLIVFSVSRLTADFQPIPLDGNLQLVACILGCMVKHRMDLAIQKCAELAS